MKWKEIHCVFNPLFISIVYLNDVTVVIFQEGSNITPWITM